MRHQCLVLPEDLGPFLLGQLDQPEEARVQALVAECPTCVAEIRALRPVVAALGTASAASQQPAEPARRPGPVVAPAAPAPGFDGVLTAVHLERAQRRRRPAWLLAAAAAVLAVAVTLGAVAVLARSGDNAGREVALVGQGHAHGTAVVAQRDWGTSIALTVSGLQPGKPYGAWLEDKSGDRVPAGTFTPRSDGTVRLDLSALMSVHDAAAMGVTQLDGDDVLRYDF
jgi:hypothetical protein